MSIGYMLPDVQSISGTTEIKEFSLGAMNKFNFNKYFIRISIIISNNFLYLYNK